MADDCIELTDDLPFHPTDSPRGMHYYDMDILTDTQQKKLNNYKRKTIRNTERYLNDNPTIRALVAIIYRVVLCTQPKRNLHLTIAEYFSKPKSEIEQDVKEYLQRRGFKGDEFRYLSKSVGDDEVFSESDSEKEIALTTYVDLKDEGVKDKISDIAKEDMPVSDEHKTEAEFMHGLLTEHLNKQLAEIPSSLDREEYTLRFKDTDENLDALITDADKAIKAKGVSLIDKLEESEMYKVLSEGKFRAKKKTSKKVSVPNIEPVDKTEEEWLVEMTEQHSERHKVLLQTITSENYDPERARKWYILQMVNAERQWKLLQIALQGNITPEVQDALRDWQIALMERTQNMSPEMKELQMDWLEGQMTQGGTMSRSMIQILRLWQTHILLQGSVMSPAMIQNEIMTLGNELLEVDKLVIDFREEQRDRIQNQIKQMERVGNMIKAMQDLERMWLQSQIDELAQCGYLTTDVLKMQVKHLNLQKKHEIILPDDFEAKMQVLKDQIDYGRDNIRETLLANKKWIQWQLADRKISQKAYESKREFINDQLNTIGVTTSQMLVAQMKWLQDQLQSNFISKEAYENQKISLECRVAELDKVTVTRMQEELNWLEKQFELGNVSDQKRDPEKAILIEKIGKLVIENKTVEELHFDLKTLQKDFGEGKVPEADYHTMKKYLRERIMKLKKEISQGLVADMQALELQMQTGGISTEEYEDRKQYLQREIDTKVSDKTFTDLTLKPSIRSKLVIPDSTIVQEHPEEFTTKTEDGSDVFTTTSPTNLVENQDGLTTQIHNEELIIFDNSLFTQAKENETDTKSEFIDKDIKPIRGEEKPESILEDDKPIKGEEQRESIQEEIPTESVKKSESIHEEEISTKSGKKSESIYEEGTSIEIKSDLIHEKEISIKSETKMSISKIDRKSESTTVHNVPNVNFEQTPEGNIEPKEFHGDNVAGILRKSGGRESNLSPDKNPPIRRTSMKISYVDLIKRNVEKEFKQSIIEVLTPDRKASVRRLIPIKDDDETINTTGQGIQIPKTENVGEDEDEDENEN